MGQEFGAPDQAGGRETRRPAGPSARFALEAPHRAPAVDTSDPAAVDRAVPRLPFVYRAGKKLRHRVSAMVARSSRVGDQSVYDPAPFPRMAASSGRPTE